MDLVQFFSLTLLILLLGGLFIWFASKRSTKDDSISPEVESEGMGYGKERWERELALWRGVLRRLEIQAEFQSPISERLQREITEAQAKIAEANHYLE